MATKKSETAELIHLTLDGSPARAVETEAEAVKLEWQGYVRTGAPESPKATHQSTT